MANDTFLKAFYALAAHVKRAELTGTDKLKLLEAFFVSQGTAAQRVVSAVRGVIYVPEGFEKRAALEDTKRLIEDMKAKANSW